MLTRIVSVLFAFVVVGGASVERCTIHTFETDAGGLTEETFHSFRRVHPQPVVIKNLIGKWRAIEAWQSPDKFLREHASIRVNMLSQVAAHRPNSYKGETEDWPSFQEYLLMDEHRDRIQFAFNNHEAYRALLPGITPIPSPLHLVHREPLISLGRNWTGSGGHAHEENWVAQISGRKAWIVAPPKSSTQAWPSVWKKPCDLLFEESTWPAGTQVCTFNPGEVLFLPDDWYHATCNLDEFTLAVGAKGASDHWAKYMFDIQAGDIEALRKSAETGTDISLGTKPVPLHFSLESGPPEVFELIVASRADVTTRNEEGELISHVAAKRNLKVLRRIINGAIGSLSDRDGFGFTPLHSAAFGGNSEMIDWLLQHRADINALAAQRETPLQVAITRHRSNIVSHLLDRRASLTHRNDFGDSLALASARFSQANTSEFGAAPSDIKSLNFATVDILLRRHALDRIPNCQALHQVAKDGSADLAELLLQNGGQRLLHSHDEDGLQATPLHFAAYEGHLPVAEVLVRYRAELSLQDGDGMTPLAYAMYQSHHAVADFLRNGPAQTRAEL